MYATMSQHACMLQFYIVAGGWTDTSRSQGFAGTEILQAGGIAWNKFAPQLPKPLHSIASVSLGSSVALIGFYFTTVTTKQFCSDKE